MFYGFIGVFIWWVYILIIKIIDHRKIFVINRGKHSLISFIFLLAFFNYWMYYGSGVLLYYQTSNKQNITFKFTNKENITTSDSLIYLGNSKEYLFFYAKPTKEQIIINRSITEIIKYQKEK